MGSSSTPRKLLGVKARREQFHTHKECFDILGLFTRRVHFNECAKPHFAYISGEYWGSVYGRPYVPAHNNAGPMCCYREAELTLGQKITDERRSHPSPKCCQLSMRHCVRFIFCKVRTCGWKNEVGTDHGVIMA